MSSVHTLPLYGYTTHDVLGSDDGAHSDVLRDCVRHTERIALTASLVSGVPENEFQRSERVETVVF